MLNRLRFFREAVSTSVVQSLASSILEEAIRSSLDQQMAGVSAENDRKKMADVITICLSALLGAGFTSLLNEFEDIVAREGIEGGNIVTRNFFERHLTAIIAVVGSFVLNKPNKYLPPIDITTCFRFMSMMLTAHTYCELSHDEREGVDLRMTASL